MYRSSATCALSAVFAAAALLASPSSVLADEVDDYYEDEYDDDVSEVDAVDETADSDEVVAETSGLAQYARSGFYIYAGGAYVFPHSGSNTGGVDIRTGFRFRKYFGAEFEYQAISMDLFLPEGKAPPIEDFEQVDVHSMTVNAKFYYPIKRWQPFVQLGIGMALMDFSGIISKTAFEIRFGAGMEFFVTEQIAFSMSVLHTKPIGKFDFFDSTGVVASVGYHF